MPDLPTMREMIEKWRRISTGTILRGMNFRRGEMCQARECAEQLESLCSQLAALPRYWTTFEDGMFDLELAPGEHGQWIKLSDVLAILGPAKETPAGEPTETKEG